MNKLLKLISLLLFSVPVYIIYSNAPIKYNYVALGDNYNNRSYNYYNFIEDSLRRKNKLKSFNSYTKSDILINDVYNEILLNNRLKKDLREANILTISMGYNDINYGKRYTLKDINKLIKEVTKYYKRTIYLIEIPNKDNLDNIKKINDYYKELSNTNNKIKYIEVDQDNKRIYYQELSIANLILKTLEK